MGEPADPTDPTGAAVSVGVLCCPYCGRDTEADLVARPPDGQQIRVRILVCRWCERISVIHDGPDGPFARALSASEVLILESQPVVIGVRERIAAYERISGHSWSHGGPTHG